jgi:hypothetical protein
MARILSVIAFMFCAALVYADPVTPGEIQIVQAGDKEAKAKPGDIVAIRIPNPALAKMVSDLDVSAKAGAKFVGAVNANDKRDGKNIPGSTHILVYVAIEKGNRSGTVEYSYKDGAGTEHKHKLMIQIEGK